MDETYWHGHLLKHDDHEDESGLGSFQNAFRSDSRHNAISESAQSTSVLGRPVAFCDGTERYGEVRCALDEATY